MAAVSRGAFAAALAAPRARVRRRPLAGVRRPSGLVVASSTADADLSSSGAIGALDDRAADRATSVAAEAGMSPEDAIVAMATLEGHVPGLARRVHAIRPADLALALRHPAAARAFADAARRVLPDSDCSRVVAANPAWIHPGAPLDDLEARVEDFRAACPQLDVDAVVTDYPALLDIPNVSRLMDALAARCLGECDVDRVEDARRRVANEPNCLIGIAEAEEMIEDALGMTWVIESRSGRNGPRGTSETIIRWKET